ncbi:KdsC family phosphatase [Endomicrobium proavitum]|uniref:3-deoxy-D-manno-octulosonate 8-phosphate phosphatase KdsC n=1 Tax=Endomicrobium proavitum TaxID=1408281 RepID=A0A0G3WJ31_9BACT|nr:HAD hydrolase family protein [Endomicrobium proavitum]AKL97459.1 3-deoxy-D-manno-octulosonate 8-phosphate phosphatase [Endomicrobium proavitum]
MKISAKILKKAKKIKLLASDVDGVLTGGEIIILNNGEEVKIWNVKDGLGFSDLLRQVFPRIKTAWITGRKSEQVKNRAENLKIDYLVQGSSDKISALNAILSETGYDASQTAYIGDDIVDIPVLKKVGFSICPKDASCDVKKYVDYVSAFDGGEGVAREAVEIILKAKNEWKKVLEKYK